MSEVMDMTNVRKTLISTGDHIGAERLLGADYSDKEYIEAVNAAHYHGVGEAYANRILGADVSDDAVDEDVVVEAAERRLRARGIHPAKATYQEYADALVEASP